MQTLDVISVNLWQILISLANLVLLFLLVKKFLYKPVKNILAKRESELEAQYDAARKAETDAAESRRQWEETLASADAQAEEILRTATERAHRRGESLVAEAQQKAEELVRSAQTEAALERQKATEGIKKEIVEVSGALAEKMLERELKTDDHRALIDSFIEKIGDGDD